MSEGERILVLATAGLERFVPALGAMASIRAFHTAGRIVLLTTPIAEGFAASAPYFDEVWSDETRGSFDLARLLNLRRRLRSAPFARVYDFDNDRHAVALFRLMHGFTRRSRRAGIAWSGTIPGTALCHDDPRRAAMHIADRWAAQLKIAGIGGVLRPDLSWIARQVKSFTLPFRMTEPFALMAMTPGPGAGWSDAEYAELARALEADGQRPVMVGHDVPAEIVAAVCSACPAAINLTGRGTVNELVLLAWAAAAAVGPDNGVMQLTTAAGCRSVVLFNAASDPALVGPRGGAATILRRADLREIPVGEVVAALRARSRART